MAIIRDVIWSEGELYQIAEYQSEQELEQAILQVQKMTLPDVLLESRQHLLHAVAQHDVSRLGVLKTTFGVLVEAVYETQDEARIGLLVALEDTARDASLGVGWKGEIPSEAMIRQVFVSVA